MGFGRLAAVGGAFQSQLPATATTAPAINIVKATTIFVFIIVCANSDVTPLRQLRISCDLIGVTCPCPSDRCCWSVVRQSVRRLRIFTENSFARSSSRFAGSLSCLVFVHQCPEFCEVV